MLTAPPLARSDLKPAGPGESVTVAPHMPARRCRNMATKSRLTGRLSGRRGEGPRAGIRAAPFGQPRVESCRAAAPPPRRRHVPSCSAVGALKQSARRRAPRDSGLGPVFFFWRLSALPTLGPERGGGRRDCGNKCWARQAQHSPARCFCASPENLFLSGEASRVAALTRKHPLPCPRRKGSCCWRLSDAADTMSAS